MARATVVFLLPWMLAVSACGGTGVDSDADVADVVEEAEAVPDAEPEDAEPDAESDAEEDAAEDAPVEDAVADDAPTCIASTDPLTLWDERSEISLVGGGPATRVGEIARPCQVDGYRVVGAAGMRVRFEVNFEAETLLAGRVALHDAGALSGGTATLLGAQTGAPGYTAILEADLSYGGEYLLVVHDADLHDSGTYALNASCVSGCDKRATRFPIVLLHGFGGWGTILNFLEYYYGVQDDLADLGYDVHVPVADASNDCEVRSAQFAEQIDDILEQTKARKVSFVTHSQGGLDGRRLISSMGYADRVGALVMISTPNQGTYVADAMTGDAPVTSEILFGLFDLWSGILGWDEASTRAAFEQLTTSEIRDVFNPANPDMPGVLYWSWAGRSCTLFDFDCQDDNNGEIVDPLLRITYGVLDGDGGDQGPNDGLVTVESATYGDFKGTIPGDHWDEIGQLADGGPSGAFDHLAFYESIAAQLYAAGL